MRYLNLLPALALGFVLFAVSANAQTDTQTVDVTVASVMEISLGDRSVPITIEAPAVGQATSATTGTSSYDFSSNAASVKITAELEAAPQDGLTLSANIAAPGTGASAGDQTLGTTPVDLVTGVTPVSSENNEITYTASVTNAVATGDYSNTVTFTITEDN